MARMFSRLDKNLMAIILFIFILGLCFELTYKEADVSYNTFQTVVTETSSTQNLLDGQNAITSGGKSNVEKNYGAHGFLEQHSLMDLFHAILFGLAFAITIMSLGWGVYKLFKLMKSWSGSE